MTIEQIQRFTFGMVAAILSIMNKTMKDILASIQSPSNATRSTWGFGKRYESAARKLEIKGLVTVSINEFGVVLVTLV